MAASQIIASMPDPNGAASSDSNKVAHNICIIGPMPKRSANRPTGYCITKLATAMTPVRMIALTLFALWPFTRLVHAFSAPIGYLFRPYIVYRSRDVTGGGELVGSHPRRRGW